jgi:NAD(P)-dependent dehydrogenase (short-subunit alcohol dehydrogenase family)
MRFADRVAVVTGAASGIGRATAVRLAAEGAAVAVLDIDAPGSAETVALIEAAGGRALAVTTDVSDEQSVAEALARVEAEVGLATVIVNNAGILHVAPALETTAADFDRVIRINLRSVFLVSVAAGRRLRDTGTPGAMVNVSSIHAVLSERNAAPYTAAKGGIEAMSRTFASEWAEYGIRVNCVRPGATRTPLTTDLYTPEIIAGLEARVPMRTAASAEQIAAGICFLASDDASYCTGTTLDIDGGYIMDGSLPGVSYS